MRPAQIPDVEFVQDVLTRLDATRPERALTREELPDLVRDQLRDLVRSGLLVEATHGRFYLNASWRDAAPSRRAIALLYWSIVIIVPLALIWYFGGTRR